MLSWILSNGFETDDANHTKDIVKRMNIILMKISAFKDTSKKKDSSRRVIKNMAEHPMMDNVLSFITLQSLFIEQNNDLLFKYFSLRALRNSTFYE
ncbi:MAG TPA: hypothetical protein VJI75_03590 [Candidatus Nanoarchaeia archaeon]|nr:hypothetical protein [Candidatus Nanoarchaeia archaeon]